MTATRPTAVAGTFYPADPAELATMLDAMLDVTNDAPAPDGTAVAYVVPHAGYRWSGPTAARVYRELREGVQPFERAVVLGPAHQVALRGAAVPTVAAWASPLGPVDIDQEAGRLLVARGLAVADDRPHAPEHSIEVQVPFLLRVHLRKMLPVLVGPGDPDATAALLSAVAGPGTVVICSTDLSHYLTEAEAHSRDAATAAAIGDLAPERIGEGDACGRHALRGLLTWARNSALRVERLALATSADTGGPKDRVVGYPAFRISE
ncbi:AmmeMemoRadiSam system protein B [Dactylosporangium sp. NBC_01737]|uniref:AmmeMemoRadiSam system protein B n=1 Tax=Dactylosporangium sp. NBC_01737 TaxID=2975959 RepID=UPI002E0E377D|nr:AmmeMemoRadiSam system protein B [Dactylosporangium sp. NBC_01737]